MLSLSLSPCIV